VIPEPMITEELAIIPGTDGEKMSKSKNNIIPIFGSEKEIKKAIMSITTDSTPIEEPKEFETCIIYNMYKLFATKEQLTQMQINYKNGNYGYGHAKLELLEMMLTFFKPARQIMTDLNNNHDEVEKLMKLGAEKARTLSQKKIRQVRKAVGLGEYYG
ncbi:MAG: tryptophan--tRNA ligase, partial [Brevinema sp.]